MGTYPGCIYCKNDIFFSTLNCKTCTECSREQPQHWGFEYNVPFLEGEVNIHPKKTQIVDFDMLLQSHIDRGDFGAQIKESCLTKFAKVRNCNLKYKYFDLVLLCIYHSLLTFKCYWSFTKLKSFLLPDVTSCVTQLRIFYKKIQQINIFSIIPNPDCFLNRLEHSCVFFNIIPKNKQKILNSCYLEWDSCDHLDMSKIVYNAVKVYLIQCNIPFKNETIAFLCDYIVKNRKCDFLK